MLRESLKAGSHIFVWLSYVAFAILVFGYDRNLKDYIGETFVSISISAIMFYLHLYAILPFIERKKYLWYIILLLGSFVLNAALRLFVSSDIWKGLLGVEIQDIGYSLTKKLLVFSWQWLPFILFSAGLWYKRRRDKSERERIIEKLEIAVIKAKIDPHFLFNSLNMLKVEAEDTLPRVANGIDAMMNILRSTIVKVNTDGLLPLADEIKVIDSLVNIYTMRFPNMDLSYMKVIHGLSGTMIAPHLLTALVENMFKHGSFKPNTGNYIKLHLDDGNLSFEVYNKKAERSEAESFHIGSSYIKVNLDEYYKGRHSLSITESDADYMARLQIYKLDHTISYELHHN